MSNSLPRISITVDDPNLYQTPLLHWQERNNKILEALHSFKLKAGLFVCGQRVDSVEGNELLHSWDESDHFLANHSYSHRNFNSEDVTAENFIEDFLKAESIIKGFRNFRPIFRFPFLKEGNTAVKRDKFRDFLTARGYINGAVTIDASDWYINDRLIEKLKVDADLNLTPYREVYLRHISDRADFYHNLGLEVFNRSISHTLLIHHNLLNTLFLNDLLEMFRNKNWQLQSAADSYLDPVFQISPDTVPAGEGLIWAAAKEKGRRLKELRYPAEDEEYEKEEMDKLGL